MSLRLGPGPVFAYEWLTAARRWQTYAIRAGFVGLILVGMAPVWLAMVPPELRGRVVSFRELAVVGESLYRAIALFELSLVLQVGPALTAGAVCQDKARGTLDHMLATDLSNAEIVLGKLGVRLIPVLGLVACALPVLSMASLLGGIDPTALLGLFLTAIGCALVGCSLAMTVSTYGRKTHEVLALTYLILILWLIAPVALDAVGHLLPWRSAARSIPVEGWAEGSNPYLLAFAPYNRPARLGVGAYFRFLAGALAVAIACAALATVRIRRVAASQAGRPAVGRRRWAPPRLVSMRWLPGPSLDGNPVAWREWHRARPSRMLRLAWGLYSLLGLLWVALAWSGIGFGARGETLAFTMLFQVGVGLLLLSVGAATSLAEERVRGSLDVLLSTPLSTRSIVEGTWWGSFRRVLGIAIWPAAILLPTTWEQGRWVAYLALLALVVAYGASITSLGLAIATRVGRPGRAVALCVAVYVVVAVGWPILVFLMFNELPRSEFLILYLFMGAPPIGAPLMSIAVALPDAPMAGGWTFDDLVGGAILWTAVHVGASMLLNKVACAFLDECLGRIPGDDPWRPRPPRRRVGGRVSRRDITAAR